MPEEENKTEFYTKLKPTTLSDIYKLKSFTEDLHIEALIFLLKILLCIVDLKTFVS